MTRHKFSFLSCATNARMTNICTVHIRKRATTHLAPTDTKLPYPCNSSVQALAMQAITSWPLHVKRHALNSETPSNIVRPSLPIVTRTSLCLFRCPFHDPLLLSINSSTPSIGPLTHLPNPSASPPSHPPPHSAPAPLLTPY